jgi:hypothetical protein
MPILSKEISSQHSSETGKGNSAGEDLQVSFSDSKACFLVQTEEEQVVTGRISSE